MKWSEMKWSEGAVNWSEVLEVTWGWMKGISHGITYLVTGTPQCIATLILLLMQLWLYSFCVVIQFIVWAVLCSVSVNWLNSCVVLCDMCHLLLCVFVCVCYLLCRIVLPLLLGWQPICSPIIMIIIIIIIIDTRFESGGRKLKAPQSSQGRMPSCIHSWPIRQYFGLLTVSSSIVQYARFEFIAFVDTKVLSSAVSHSVVLWNILTFRRNKLILLSGTENKEIKLPADFFIFLISSHWIWNNFFSSDISNNYQTTRHHVTRLLLKLQIHII
jgi:hypothetical protein